MIQETMIQETNTYIRIKGEHQKIWDFAILICHSIPNLKKTIKGVKENIPNYSLPKPDYFEKTENIERLKAISEYYKFNLSKYMVISLFSFFESYFKSVFEEMIEFHGGKENFINYISKKQKSFININNPDIKECKRKVQEPEKQDKKQQYEKYTKILSQRCDFRFPGELFALYGIKCFLKYIFDSNFKSVMITSILKDILHMDLSDKINNHPDLIDMDLEQTFESMRVVRNRISHGDEPDINIGKVAAYSDFIRIFTIRIDNHLISNFFVLQKDM